MRYLPSASWRSFLPWPSFYSNATAAPSLLRNPRRRDRVAFLQTTLHMGIGARRLRNAWPARDLTERGQPHRRLASETVWCEAMGIDRHSRGFRPAQLTAAVDGTALLSLVEGENLVMFKFYVSGAFCCGRT